MTNLNFESDQSAIDNVEAVTFTSVATAGNATVSIADAGFYRTGGGITEDEPSAGAYQRFDATFSIRASLLNGVGGAKPGDTITRADGSVWTVLRASPPVVSGIWQLTTISLAIAGALQQMGTLDRPTLGQDSAGRQSLASYVTIAGNVTCWVEPMDSTATDRFERRTMGTSAVAYLASPVTAQAKDRFTVGTTVYSVLKSTKPDRLDKMQELELELLS